jgi:hypothetical protein
MSVSHDLRKSMLTEPNWQGHLEIAGNRPY